MITITFDAMALFMGFCIGLFFGFIVYSLFEMREGGQWSSGWASGYKSGTELRKYIENSVRNEKAVKQDADIP